MAYAVNVENVVAFLGGFLVGKIVGSLVSMLPIWGFLMENPSIADILLESSFTSCRPSTHTTMPSQA
jgi:hypothetical protein